MAAGVGVGVGLGVKVAVGVGVRVGLGVAVPTRAAMIDDGPPWTACQPIIKSSASPTSKAIIPLSRVKELCLGCLRTCLLANICSTSSLGMVPKVYPF